MIRLKLKTYSIVSDAIGKGIECGYIRSFKHTDVPDTETIKQNILNYVMLELDGIIDWEDDKL